MPCLCRKHRTWHHRSSRFGPIRNFPAWFYWIEMKKLAVIFFDYTCLLTFLLVLWWFLCIGILNKILNCKICIFLSVPDEADEMLSIKKIIGDFFIWNISSSIGLHPDYKEIPQLLLLPRMIQSKVFNFFMISKIWCLLYLFSKVVIKKTTILEWRNFSTTR